MKTAFLVAGLGYGDEGKGATVDYLVREKKAQLVVRYNGGPQAAHNVVSPTTEEHHTFAQFGSGSLVPNVRTHLSRFMLVDPISMLVEGEALWKLGVTDIWMRTTVDGKVVIVTPFQKALNRLQRVSDGRFNSCGMGVGLARGDFFTYGNAVLFAEDLYNEKRTKDKLRFLLHVCRRKMLDWTLVDTAKVQEHFYWKELLDVDDGWVNWCWERYQEWSSKVRIISFEDRLGDPDIVVVFEGAQGVLLDEKYGEEGFNTWTNTTFDNALTLLKEASWNGATVKLGVMRPYLTRHGDGPLPTESTELTKQILEKHNGFGQFQGPFRCGWLNLEQIHQAMCWCGGMDGIVLNHLDHLGPWKARGTKEEYTDWLEETLKVPVVITGTGPTAADRRMVSTKKLV